MPFRNITSLLSNFPITVTYPTPESITASMAAILGSGFTALFTAIFPLFAEDDPPHHMKKAVLCYVFLMTLGGVAYCMN